MNPELKKRIKLEIKEWGQSIIIAFVLAMIIRTFVVQAFKIPSGSMRPTFLEGDRILVNKFIYRFHEPERGDIVVFKYPEDTKKDFVKRLIAKGGEVIEIKNGNIYINDKLANEPGAIRDVYYYNRGDSGKEGQKIAVPKNSYYVLGDNSGSSRDSRYWGFVPKKYLLGKAFLIYWPPNRIKIIKE
ncbi:MAG: signal peptidase I [Candidatus Omnitrophica bacterium]|nr:signal peptidase I [Candidatus Omnitrophota bacterium]